MSTTAEKWMTSSVVTVSPESPLVDVLRLFVEEGIHGAPVVDEEERVVGVVTTSDLLQAENAERDTASVSANYLREYLEFSGPDWSGPVTDLQDRLAQQTVADIMTDGAVTVARDASIGEVARCLREHRIHRVWVEHEGRICGVISTFDLLPLIEKNS